MSLLDDLPVVVAIAGGCAVAVAAAGAALLRRSRHRPVAVSLNVVALVPLLAALTAAVSTAVAMFLSAHDLGVIVLVVLVSGAVGVVTAFALSRMVADQARDLSSAASHVPDGTYLPVPGPLATEFAAIDQRLTEVNERLVRSRARADALETSRRNLVAWMSHDLRTPLAGIRAMTEALEDDVLDHPEEVRTYHRRIRVESERLSTMVDDLFELSRLDARLLTLTLTRVPIADLVGDAVSSTLPLASAKGVRLVLGQSPTLLVGASVHELGRALRNLLSNAIRYTPAGGAVSVCVRTEGSSAVVEVLDGCGGIPVEDLTRLFDVGFRGTFARTPGDGGAGLGLAIARGVVEAHAGELDIDNVNGGCRAVLRLPLALDRSGTSGATDMAPTGVAPTA